LDQTRGRRDENVTQSTKLNYGLVKSLNLVTISTTSNAFVKYKQSKFIYEFLIKSEKLYVVVGICSIHAWSYVRDLKEDCTLFVERLDVKCIAMGNGSVQMCQLWCAEVLRRPHASPSGG